MAQNYDICRIEILQSTKDGFELTSFKLKNDASVRFPCSLYSYSQADSMYSVSKYVILTPWKVPSSLLSPVELLVDQATPGK